ncbi:SHOCT domain-containing protein [Methanobrevibacter sp.]|uniref:SHOCT domain-containing protein n=1 Tax=Methanobrevibacter sp. TaxID=66852 RepID=UPI003869B9B9
MGLFSRKKKEPVEEYTVPEEKLQEIIENGVSIEVAIDTHGADEIVAGAMLGTTGKLIAMGNYGKPIYKHTTLFINEEGLRFQLTGDFFRYTDIYSLDAPYKVGPIHAEFNLVTTSGEVGLRATNSDFLAIRELFIRFVEAYDEHVESVEKQEEKTKIESDMDRLIRLGELHERGLLSDEEFETAKKKLL